MKTRETPIDTAMLRGDRSAGPDPTLMLDTRKVDIPLDHNPDAVIGEGPSSHAAKGAMMSIWTTWNAVKTAAEDRNTDLPALARVGQQAVERGLAAADKASAAIMSNLAALDREITSAIRPPVPDALSVEIRQYWRREGDEKLGALMSAIQSDTRTSSAVLSAPAYLSGLDDEQQENFRAVAVNAHAPERQADLEEAQRALAKVQAAAERVTQTLGPKITLWSNPEPTAMRQLRSLADAR